MSLHRWLSSRLVWSTKDWGFSGWVEVAGKRIWFDIGNDADIFAANVKAKRSDLGTLDFRCPFAPAFGPHGKIPLIHVPLSGGVRKAMQRVSVALAIVFS